SAGTRSVRPCRCAAYLRTVLRCSPHCPPGSVLSAFVQGTPPIHLATFGGQAARATGLCPPVTVYVRPWPPTAPKASSAVGGLGALLSAIGQREVLRSLAGWVASPGQLGHL